MTKSGTIWWVVAAAVIASIHELLCMRALLSDC